MTKPAQSKKFRRLTLSHVDRPNGRGYFTRYKGKQKWFGYVSEDEANRLLAAFENEILNPPAEQPAAQRPLSVQDVLTRFLRSLELDVENDELKESTRDFYLYAIKGLAKKPRPDGKPRKQRKQRPFVPFLTYLENAGHSALPIDHFGESVVKEWLAEHFAGRSNNYRTRLKRPIKAAFNWAAKQNEFASRLPRNPLAGMQIPKCEPCQTFLTDEQWAAVKAAASGPFLDLLTVLESSGARPQELRVATAANLDHDLRCLYFEEQVKETDNTDPRVIFLDGDAYAICKRLADQNPDGPIFRNSKGRPWAKDSIGCQCSRLRKKLDFKFNVYLLRHRFCQNMLERGTPETELQHLMGHKDGRMISTTYNKMKSRLAYLRQAYDKRRSA